MLQVSYNGLIFMSAFTMLAWIGQDLVEDILYKCTSLLSQMLTCSQAKYWPFEQQTIAGYIFMAVVKIDTI